MTENIEIDELIEDFNQYIKLVATGSITIAESFRNKQVEIALKEVTNFVEGMNWLITANNYFKTQNVISMFNEQKIVGFFEEINEGLTMQDYFLVADLFEYEIAQYFADIPVVTVKN
ncbi:hypothetical protein MKY27_03360 [Solibacillus sp. FSL R5-0449]|uniref:hypothetical protein n=1 Tax=Solibacillus sp. FSL R5-0449 TaxID=2921639 RepID=UPI0030CBE2CB